jgi:hypothetical protein
MTAIDISQVRPGMFIDHGGKRWQVAELLDEAAGSTRLRLRRPWIPPRGERTSAYWMPGQTVTLDRDQGVCFDCGQPLVPGLGEEAHNWRTRDGGRYFCRVNADALHQPAEIQPAGR